jgi:arginase
MSNTEFEIAEQQDGPQKIVVVHNTMDDEGGGDHVDEGEASESVEGGRYVLPAIRDRIDTTRFDIEELGVIEMDLNDDPGDPTAKHLSPILESAPKGISQVYKAFKDGNKVLTLGGNHVRALDVIGALRACHEMGVPFGMIWVDQHLDLNTPETSPSGNIHGMVSAVLQGKGPKGLLELLEGAPFIDPKNMIYIGVQVQAIDGDTDENGEYLEGTEGYFLRQLEEKGVRCFTADGMAMDKEEGRISDEAKEAATELSDRIQKEGGKLWTEWDVDSVDTEDMPAAVMKCENGLSAAQMRDLFEHLEAHCSIDGMGVSEISPEKDINGKSKDLIAEGVSKILGVSHEEAAVLSFRQPNVWNRTWKIALTTAASIAAAIGIHQLNEAPDVKPVRPIVDNSHSEFLDQFTQSDFRKAAGELKLAADVGDLESVDTALERLATIYTQESRNAPSAAATSDLGRLALSEFRHGFTGGSFAGSADLEQYYQVYLEKVRSAEGNA